MVIVLVILFIHWFADFCLQTDWQAKNKSTNNVALSLHVFSYSLVWTIVSIAYAACTLNPWALLFAPVTFVCHWATDYCTSRLNKRLLDRGDVHNFFVSIGFDQWLHYLQLFLTYNILC